MKNDERPLPPSARKLRKAREKGEAPFSQELSNATVLLGGILLAIGVCPLLWKRCQELMMDSFSSSFSGDATQVLGDAFSLLAMPVALFLIGVFFITLLISFGQRGGNWHWNPRKTVIVARPFKGGMMRLAVTFIKILFCAGIVFVVLRQLGHEVTFFRVLSMKEKGGFFLEKLTLLSFGMASLFFILGIGDFIYQRWLFIHERRMTLQEAREEKREAEGDAELKKRLKK